MKMIKNLFGENVDIINYYNTFMDKIEVERLKVQNSFECDNLDRYLESCLDYIYYEILNSDYYLDEILENLYSKVKNNNIEWYNTLYDILDKTGVNGLYENEIVFLYIKDNNFKIEFKKEFIKNLSCK